jgi:hypothetical protein
MPCEGAIAPQERPAGFLSDGHSSCFFLFEKCQVVYPYIISLVLIYLTISYDEITEIILKQNKDNFNINLFR